MRRKPGTLLPLELQLLEAGLEFRRHSDGEFHGFAIAKALQEASEARRLTAHGTLYKALARLEAGGLLESRWEDPERAVEEGRPRRRLYRVTGAGELAIQSARLLEDAARRMNPGLQPS